MNWIELTLLIESDFACLPFISQQPFLHLFSISVSDCWWLFVIGPIEQCYRLTSRCGYVLESRWWANPDQHNCTKYLLFPSHRLIVGCVQLSNDAYCWAWGAQRWHRRNDSMLRSDRDFLWYLAIICPSERSHLMSCLLISQTPDLNGHLRPESHPYDDMPRYSPTSQLQMLIERCTIVHTITYRPTTTCVPIGEKLSFDEFGQRTRPSISTAIISEGTKRWDASIMVVVLSHTFW